MEQPRLVLKIEVEHLTVKMEVLHQDESIPTDPYTSGTDIVFVYSNDVIGILKRGFPQIVFDTHGKKFIVYLQGTETNRDNEIASLNFSNKDDLNLFLTNLQQALRVINGSASKFSHVSTGEDE